MRRLAQTLLAVALGLSASACDWRDVAVGLAVVSSGGVAGPYDRVTVVDVREHSTGDCDEWYDFGDPGCW